jgi:GntR family transcriptional regulator
MLQRSPVYQQLAQQLAQLAASDAIGKGAKFLTERQIASRFGVSRATANKALAALVADGTLEFRAGIGTFVRRQRLGGDLRTLVSFTSRANAAGLHPTTRVLAFRTIDSSLVDPAIQQLLQLQTAEPLFDCLRLRSVDRRPVILERRLIVAKHCPSLTRDDLKGSLYSVWTERFGLQLDHAEQTVRAVGLSDADADRLRDCHGAAALQIVAIGRLRDGQSLWWESTLYRGDAYELTNRLSGTISSGPALGQFLLPLRDGESIT